MVIGRHGHLRCVALLASAPAILAISLGARAGEIHDAVRSNNVSKVIGILNGPGGRMAVNASGARGATPLHLAALADNKTMAAVLISRGADVNARMDGSLTPLHCAAHVNAAETASLLIDMGADPNSKSASGRTPLEWARKKGATDVVKILLAAESKPREAPPPVPSLEEKGAGWKLKGQALFRSCRDLEKDNAYETVDDWDGRLKIENHFDLKKWGIVGALGGEVRYGSYVSNKEADAEFLLREAYVELRREQYVWSLGRQTVTWGKLDDIVILDCLNPQDYRWFVLYDKQERKEPQYMLKANYFLDGLQVELVCMPTFEPSKIEFFDTDWSMFGHLKDMINDGPYPPAVKALVNNIRIEDNESSNHAQVGVRLRGTVSDVDYAIYYMSIHNRIPAIKERTAKGNLVKRFLFEPEAQNLLPLSVAGLTPEDLTLEAGYERVNVFGVDFEAVAGEYGLRGECGYFTGSPYVREPDFSYVKKDNFSAGFGIDHTTEDNFYWNVQMEFDVVSDYEDLFGVERFSQQVVLNLHKDFFMGDLLFNWSSAYRLTYKDWILNPELRYKVTGELQLACGALLMGGDPQTLFGRYDDKDLAYMEARYRF